MHEVRKLILFQIHVINIILYVFSTNDWVISGKRVSQGLTEKLSLRPGAPCDNFQGYCDVFLKCRQVRSQGPSSGFMLQFLTRNIQIAGRRRGALSQTKKFVVKSEDITYNSSVGHGKFSL